MSLTSDVLRGRGTPARTLVMGVLNVTPDSFSDGGMWIDPDAAVGHGNRLIADGADLVDIGGESTRPGAQRVPADEELRRALPVVRALAAEGVAVSIDTMRAEVAELAIDAGATLVNDVSGGLADPAMLPMLAERGVPVVLMHWRAHSAVMHEHAAYADVVSEVVAELHARVDAAVAAGVDPGRIVIDPGIGFAKRAEHGWALLAALDELVAAGFPVLIGASRKSFLRDVSGWAGAGEPVAPGRDPLDDLTAAISSLAARAGVWGVRVHDAGPSAAAVRLVARVRAFGRRPRSVGSEVAW